MVDGKGYIQGVSNNVKTNLVEFDRSNNYVNFMGGNVGVGIATPQGLFQVAPSGTPAFTVRNSANGRVVIGLVTDSANTAAGDLEINSQAGTGTTGMTFNVGDATNSGNIYWRSNTSNNTVQIVGNPGNQYLAMATAATERMRINAAGNVGVGTTGPGSVLEVNLGSKTTTTNNGAFSLLQPSLADGNEVAMYIGKAATTSQGAFYGYHYTAGGDSYLWMTNYGDGESVFNIHKGGNVGVGTTSPLSRLHVNGPAMTAFTGSAAGTMLIDAPYGASGNQYRSIDFTYNSSIPVGRIASLNNGSGTYMQFGTSDNYGTGITNTAVTIDPSGNVGVGTTSPNNYGQGNAGPIMELRNTGGSIFPWVYLSTDQTASGKYIGGYGFGTSGSSASDKRAALIGAMLSGDSTIGPVTDLMLYTSNGAGLAERMRISAAGNVGVGTTSPVSKLHITGTSGGGYSTSNTFTLQRTDATNPTGRIDFTGSGGSGSTRWSLLSDADVTNDFGIAYNGSKVLQITTAGNVGVGPTLPPL